MAVITGDKGRVTLRVLGAVTPWFVTAQIHSYNLEYHVQDHDVMSFRGGGSGLYIPGLLDGTLTLSGYVDPDENFFLTSGGIPQFAPGQHIEARIHYQKANVRDWYLRSLFVTDVETNTSVRDIVHFRLNSKISDVFGYGWLYNDPAQTNQDWVVSPPVA
jgi:hypothetical protein